MSVNIERLNHTLNGVSKDENGKIIFVEGSLVGEEIEYQVKKKHRKYNHCTVTQIIKASENRIDPKCPHSIINAPLSICGGCSLQFLDNKKQIEYKEKIVLEQLTHQLGDIQFTLIPALHTQDYHYRYKARLGVRYDTTKKKLYLGFREKFSHYLVDMSQCPILANSITQSLFALRDLVQKLSCYRHIPQIEAASGYRFAKAEHEQEEYQTSYIIRHLEDFNDEDIKLIKQFSEQYQVKIFSQRGKPNSIKKLFPVSQSAFLSYTTLDDQVLFDFFPTDFTQVNSSMNNLLLKTVLELIPMSQEHNVVDLFCGIGNFAISIAHKVKSVIGVEVAENMCMRARHNAQLNQLDNTEFVVGDLYSKDFLSDEVMRHIKHKFSRVDLLILDPPRSGAEEVVKNINQFSPKKILYVSCNPATFVRDLEILKQLQYNITNMGVMDMFPQTTHIECMAILSKS